MVHSSSPLVHSSPTLVGCTFYGKLSEDDSGMLIVTSWFTMLQGKIIGSIMPPPILFIIL